MICFRDMTFCSGDGCAAFSGCHRALTGEVKSAAEKAGIPIARFTDPKEMACYVTETQECPDESPSLFD